MYRWESLMKPDTSRWRDSGTYDYFDDLSVEGLAWECLRRDPSYQQAYRTLVDTGKEAEPLPVEATRRWGLRCRRTPLANRHDAAGPLVASSEPRRHRACTTAKRPAGPPVREHRCDWRCA